MFFLPLLAVIAKFIISTFLSCVLNAFLPSALRATRGAVQAMVPPTPTSMPTPAPTPTATPESTPSAFWEKAKESEKALQDHVHLLLSNAAAYFRSSKFTDITSAMKNIVNTTATFRDNIKGALNAHHVTFDALTEELEAIFMKIVSDLEKIPPPDKAPGHTERAEMVDKILDDTALALINLVARYGVGEEVVRTYLLALKPHVHALTVAVGDINEQHPKLLSILVSAVSIMLIPESWILRPFLGMFGFGPMGPVKGSAAAWLQRRFWGSAVAAGSWFSLLQAAGMGKLPQWAGLATKAPLLAGRVWAIFRRE